MADHSTRCGGLSSGLAVILEEGQDAEEKRSKTRLFPCLDDSGQQHLERTIEYIFGLPENSIGPVDGPVDSGLIRTIINDHFSELHSNSDDSVIQRDGICVAHRGSGPPVVGLEEDSICGEIRTVKPPLVLESQALHSSARANACVSRGKWMYEVTLETSGVLELGWATKACTFTDQIGVGNADDSYAFDGWNVIKLNYKAEPYGQPWVAGDVIGCCIDVNRGEISFFRNGESLGIAFSSIRNSETGYCPAVSISRGERCELNFGAYPFKYPVEGFLPLQEPPSGNSFASQLLQCFSRLLDLQSDKVEELIHPVSSAICDEFFSVVEQDPRLPEYVGRGAFLSFMLGVFRTRAPHGCSSLDRVCDVFLEVRRACLIFEHVIAALACGCKTSTLVQTECPYLALACHLFRREDLMVRWWRSSHFEFLFEGFLSSRSPNLHDLQRVMPVVWWPGSQEDVSLQSNMGLTVAALSEAVNKIENKQRELCLLVILFVPPVSPSQLPGSVFRRFLRNQCAHMTLAPRGVTRNPVLVSLFAVILHFLSEGFTVFKGSGFLHRRGQRKFPLRLFLGNDPLRAGMARLGGSFDRLSESHPREGEVILWEEGCMDDEHCRVTHATSKRPCCCLTCAADLTRALTAPVRKPTESSRVGVAALSEEELLDALLLLYRIGVLPMFKQASYYESHQARMISLLGKIDMEIIKGARTDRLRRLKEARDRCREEVIDCVRLSAWSRISLFSWWKQRGMYALCMWVAQLLLRLSQTDSVFAYVPEFYIESLVDCFHVLRNGNPPFVPSTIFLAQGLSSFVCPNCSTHSHSVAFIATHFNDTRILSANLRDFLLQSISVLVRDKECLEAFRNSEAATHHMPAALLSSFDRRSWAPVTDILLWLCKGSGFCSLKDGESSFSRVIFQGLLQRTCIQNPDLFSAFIDRLFYTLSRTVDEFSDIVNEMLWDNREPELLQWHSCYLFELSGSLARVLEFCTSRVPEYFLSDGFNTNLIKLVELIIFILNYMTTAECFEFFHGSLRRHGQPSKKVNRGILLEPLVGIISNLQDAAESTRFDIIGLFASMNCPETFFFGFDGYISEYNGDGCLCTDEEDHRQNLVKVKFFLGSIMGRVLLQRRAQVAENGAVLNLPHVQS